MDTRDQNPDSINLDSDCEILEADNSAITILDSPSALNSTPSDLETTKITEFESESLLFEVNFSSADIFNDFKELILGGLRVTLKGHAGISIVEDDKAIQVYRKPLEEGEVLEDVGHQDAVIAVGDDTIEVEGESVYHVEDDDMGISDLFMVDTQPAERIDAIQIPSYKRTIKEILDDTSTKKKKNTEDECHRPKQNKSCFNCGETDHDLRSCPKPRNNTKINKAKKMHSSKQERYHVDIEQRYAHLRPGRVSKRLREALGISSGELPFFFYRLRVLGYPPGWLEDAKVAHSGISLFDSEGRYVLDPEDEDGQVDNDKHKYDASKIIAFPGFNADPGPHFYDDYRHHNVPPLNPEDSREEFIKKLGDNVVKGYKRKKMKDNLVESDMNEPILDTSEMEIENEENVSMANVQFNRPPPPHSSPNDQPPPPLPPTAEPSPSTPHRSPSPSLEDLEARQKRLLQELQSNVCLISDNDDSLIDDVIELHALGNRDRNATAAPIKNTLNTACHTDSEGKEDSQTTNCSEASLPQTPRTVMPGALESVLGTPVLQFSPFDKLPCGDNFKVGVSDVINFENLPDSTGTYEKMKCVIKKVRTAVTQLNSEDS